MSSVFNKSFCEKILVELVRLLTLSIKSKNPIQKYPDITESYVCILKIFFVIGDPLVFLLPIEFRIYFVTCSTPNSMHKKQSNEFQYQNTHQDLLH